MAKITTAWLVIACVIALLVGGLVTYWGAPAKVEVKTIEKQINVPVEVIKEVETIKEVPLNVKAAFLEPALKDFIKEINKDNNFVYCKGQEYDEDQINIKSDPKNWNVAIGIEETKVIFNVKMKYLDKDVEKKCYTNYHVEVLYEEDEKPQVEYYDP